MAPVDKDLDTELPELNRDQVRKPIELASFAWEHVNDADIVMDAKGASIKVPEVGSERVRFATPLSVSREDVDGDWDGIMVNLSAHGLACVLPLELQKGEQVYVSFRLSLSDEPLAAACEVVWRRPDENGQMLYGLCFIELPEDEAQQIEALVTERVEGRAGEWPLPVMPAAKSAQSPRSFATLIAALGGMAAGIVVALTFAHFEWRGSQDTAAWAAELPSGDTATIVMAESDNDVVNEESAVKPATQTPVAGALSGMAAQAKTETQNQVAEKVSPAVENVEKSAAVVENKATNPAPAVARVAEAKKKPPVSELSAALPRLAREVAEPAAAETDSLVPFKSSSNAVELALRLNGPASEHKTFWMEKPRRLVVDVSNRQSAFESNNYVIKSSLASRLRVGNHADKVRFVLETAENVDSDVQVKMRGNDLLIALHRN